MTGVTRGESRVNKGGRNSPTQYFLYLRIVFLWLQYEEAQIKKIGAKVGERDVCILRTIPTNLPPLSNLPPSLIKFPIPIVHSAAPSPC